MDIYYINKEYHTENDDINNNVSDNADIIEYKEHNEHNEHNEYNEYNEYKDSDMDYIAYKKIDNTNATSIVTNTIDSFLTFYTYDIILLSENIKNLYMLHPDFLSKLTSSKLIDFVIDILYENNYFYVYNRVYKKFKIHQFNLSKLKKYQISQLSSPVYDFFKKKYNIENNTSFNIMFNFLKQFNIKLEYNKWIMFCYINTNV